MVMPLLIISGLYLFIRIGHQSIKSPAGIYVSDINCKDTLKLYPDGKFEQVVYNEKNILVYSCRSKWSETTMGIRVDSLLFSLFNKALSNYCDKGLNDVSSIEILYNSLESVIWGNRYPKDRRVTFGEMKIPEDINQEVIAKIQSMIQ